MKRRTVKGLVALVFACVLALLVVGCGSSEPSDAGAGSGMTELSGASGVCVTLDAESEDTFEATVTLADGEALVVASQLTSGEAEIEETLGGEYMGSDYAYEGAGISETGFEPGDYTVTIKPNEATGTVYVLAYPAGQLDFENTDTESLVSQIAEFADAA